MNELDRLRTVLRAANWTEMLGEKRQPNGWWKTPQDALVWESEALACAKQIEAEVRERGGRNDG